MKYRKSSKEQVEEAIEKGFIKPGTRGIHSTNILISVGTNDIDYDKWTEKKSNISMQELINNNMTDLDKFVNLYKSVGIEVLVNNDTDTEGSFISLSTFDDGTSTMTTDEKIDGHSGFLTILSFDKDSKFTGQGIWE